MTEPLETVEITTDTGRFALVPEWVLLSRVSDRAIRVYAVMASRWADRGDGSCWPSRSTIAATLGVSVDTVDRALADLVKHGAISIIPRHHDSGAQTSNGYVLHRVLPGRNIAAPQPQTCPPPSRNIAAPPAANLRPKQESLEQEPKNDSGDASGAPADVSPERAEELERAEKFCHWFIDQMMTATPDAKRPTVSKAWIADADRLFRLDGRNRAEVRAVVEWIYTNPAGAFWIANCRTPGKLRKQFDAIAAQMRRSGPTAAAPPAERGARTSGAIEL